MTEEQERLPNEPAGLDSRDDESATILELFGIELRVKNPRIAEILTMDAREALNTEIKWPRDAAAVRRQRAELKEAVPDAVVSPVTPKDAHEAHERVELRHRVDVLGGALGFEVGADGVWSSPTGLSIIVRTISGELSFAAASDVIRKLGAHRKTISGPDEGILLVAQKQGTVDVFTVAIRQGEYHDHIRTISAANLELARGLFADGVLDHHRVLSLLLPMADIDVGELLRVCARACGTRE